MLWEGEVSRDDDADFPLFLPLTITPSQELPSNFEFPIRRPATLPLTTSSFSRALSSTLLNKEIFLSRKAAPLSRTHQKHPFSLPDRLLTESTRSILAFRVMRNGNVHRAFTLG